PPEPAVSLSDTARCLVPGHARGRRGQKARNPLEFAAAGRRDTALPAGATRLEEPRPGTRHQDVAFAAMARRGTSLPEVWLAAPRDACQLHRPARRGPRSSRYELPRYLPCLWRAAGPIPRLRCLSS